MKKIVILIPALDPPDIFLEYVQELISSGFRDFIVVNDGSKSDDIFQTIKKMGCVVLTHKENLGKGQALKTGLAYYKEHFNSDEYAGVITADSDGQHLCKDVKKVAGCLSSGCEKLILGCRNFALPQVPPKSKFGNNLTAWIFAHLLHFRVSDTQTGLRGIPNILIESCLNLPGKRFEYETSMLTVIGRKAGIAEIPIETVYYEENKGTHFNPVMDSLKIYGTIFSTFFRYIFSALSSSLIDLGLFTLLTKGLLANVSHRIILSTCIARIVSAIYNFCVNRNVVFKSDVSYTKSALRYFALCILQGAASALLVSGLHYLTRIDEVIVKLLVDSFLFFISYHIQKRIIFK